MTRSAPGPDAPFVIPASELPAPGVEGPAEALPPPDDDALPESEAAMLRVARAAGRPRSGWGGWFWAALSSLLTLIVSVAAYDYVTGLIARFPALGYVALGLVALLAVLVAVQIVRELWAFRRLARIDGFRTDAARALADHDRARAVALSERLERFYGHRPDVRWGIGALAAQREGLLDPDAILATTERAIFPVLDAAAGAEIEAASRTVAGATALIPLALADVLTALSVNVRMIRRLADIYGAHSGLFGSWRLLRSVAAHLLATGAVAVGDDLISSVAGGHALSRLSRRFGEGMINGALTARVGIAAMEVCRPLPFAALPRPRVANVVGRSLSGLFQKG